MSKYRVHFKLVRRGELGGTGTVSESVRVEAESDKAAIDVATNKIKNKSMYRDYVIRFERVEPCR